MNEDFTQDRSETAAMGTLALAVVSVTNAPAAMALTTYGSFSWTAEISMGINSRSWTQISGTTTITSKMGCTDAYNDLYYIELFRNEIIDDSYGKKEFTCGTSITKTWSSLPSGSYHFYMSKAHDGETIKGAGSVKYPTKRT